MILTTEFTFMPMMQRRSDIVPCPVFVCPECNKPIKDRSLDALRLREDGFWVHRSHDSEVRI